MKEKSEPELWVKKREDTGKNYRQKTPPENPRCIKEHTVQWYGGPQGI